MSWIDDLDNWLNKKRKRAKRARFRELRDKVRRKNNGSVSWRPMEVQHTWEKKYRDDTGQVAIQGSKTRILYRNRITGETKIEFLEGTWSLDALRGKN